MDAVHRGQKLQMGRVGRLVSDVGMSRIDALHLEIRMERVDLWERYFVENPCNIYLEHFEKIPKKLSK